MTAIDLDKRLTALEEASRQRILILDGAKATMIQERGADLLLVETVFDTLNVRAALFAIIASIDGTVVRSGGYSP